jgi:hypothetical protein
VKIFLKLNEGKQDLKQGRKRLKSRMKYLKDAWKHGLKDRKGVVMKNKNKIERGIK